MEDAKKNYNNRYIMVKSSSPNPIPFNGNIKKKIKIKRKTTKKNQKKTYDKNLWYVIKEKRIDVFNDLNIRLC